MGLFLFHFIFIFYCFFGGGGWGERLEVLPGLLPDNTGIRWEMSNLGGGDKPPLLFSI